MKGASVWTPTAVRRLASGWGEGTPDSVIALDIGVTARAVAVKRQRMGFVKRTITCHSVRDYATETLIAELSRRGVTFTRVQRAQAREATAAKHFTF